jgi:ribonuclease E
VAPAPAPAAASGDFWDKVLSFFGIEKAEDEVVPPPKPSRETRSKRSGERNRNRRGRDSNRENQVIETTAANTMDVVNEDMTMPKAPKQSRLPKESGTGERKRNRRGSARAEQKEKVAGAEEMELLDSNNEVVKEPQEAAIIDVTETTATRTPDTPSGEDEPRRRRRRGGRNRNRRDRDSIADSAEVAEIVSGEAREIDELVDGLMADTLNQNDLAGRDVSEAAVRDTRAIEDVAFKPVETAVVQETPVENTRVTPMAFYDPNDEAINAQSEISHTDEQAASPSSMQEERVAVKTMTTEAPVETVELEVSDFFTAPVIETETIQEAVEAADDEAVIGETLRVEEPVIDEPSITPEVIVVDEPLVEPENVVLSEPMEEASTGIKTETEAERHPVVDAKVMEDFSDILASAGLTMASTDPEKLRQAQERVAQATAEEEASRPARRRRALPPVVDEPLIQVDTRK